MQEEVHAKLEEISNLKAVHETAVNQLENLHKDLSLKENELQSTMEELVVANMKLEDNDLTIQNLNSELGLKTDSLMDLEKKVDVMHTDKLNEIGELKSSITCIGTREGRSEWCT